MTLRLGEMAAVSIAFALPLMAAAAEPTVIVRPIVFPTDASVTFTDDYGDARTGGRVHEGNDLMGKKMMPLYAAVDGTVRVQTPEAEWGCRIQITDADGWQYLYYHVNNDTPGTDDGVGCTANSYAVASGDHVTAGQLVGYMGDSGNAENVGAHLHFEIRKGSPRQECNWRDWEDCDYTYTEPEPIDPYASLIAAKYPGSFDRAAATAESPDINTDQNIIRIATNELAPCASGSLIKSASSTAVYYCGADGKRYGFPNDKVYFTWYADFKTVQTITNDQLAAISLGGMVTYRPGVRMVKIESLPNVYAVAPGGVLRWIKTPEIAASMYGTKWNKNVDDVSDAFFGSYTIGDPITSAGPK